MTQTPEQIALERIRPLATRGDTLTGTRESPAQYMEALRASRLQPTSMP